MQVSVEKDQKGNYELGTEFTRDARSRILAKQRTNSKTFTPGRTDQGDADTDDHWHCFRN